MALGKPSPLASLQGGSRRLIAEELMDSLGNPLQDMLVRKKLARTERELHGKIMSRRNKRRGKGGRRRLLETRLIRSLTSGVGRI